MDNLPKFVTLHEVGPRDGLQNEPIFVPTHVKKEMIKHLIDAGLKNIEVTSFVSPKTIPQLSDATMLCKDINIFKDYHIYSALVPNTMGLKAAHAANIDKIALFTAASETFCQHNINCTINESFERFNSILSHSLLLEKKQIRAYISCAFFCPYEGKIDPQKVTTIAHKLLSMGVSEISIGDTTGQATPQEVCILLETLLQTIPTNKLAMHFHNTYGQALTNVYVSLEHGITHFDSSIAGLGGCPYADGASGNLATEDLVYMLDGLGIYSGVSLNKLVACANYICHALNKKTNAHVSMALSQKEPLC